VDLNFSCDGTHYLGVADYRPANLPECYEVVG